MNLARIFILIPILAIIVGCSKAQDGNAPGAPAVPPTTILDAADATMKYGSTMTTSSGWVVNVDLADPVQAKTTASGWQVEIKYE